MRKKAMVAMSGGVDSSVAAYLTREEGFEVMGVTLKLFENETVGASCEKSCCSLSDVEDARSVAFRLDIPYYVFNYTEAFQQQVIQRFVKAYEEGETPNPCIDCNRYIKFSQLFEQGKELGQDYIVTGHYSQIQYDSGSGRYLLKKAVDPSKDQSYVLYAMTQDQLARARFPLGGMSKRQTRRIADEQGFVNAKKRDSQDICFAPDGDYVRFIEAYTGKTYPPGDFVDLRGRVLGRHRGMISYTIGQRKGLGLALPRPMYVCGKELDTNRIVLGLNEDLFSRSFSVRDVNWIACDVPRSGLDLKVKIRYRQQEQAARVIPTGDDTVQVEFTEPQRAITKGQAAVFYDGDVVVGGGRIGETV
ncbi:tRNA 2-thiouridine(34) synthase MnmA [bacterium 210820-DFI.6.37]|nr:tRNA 2-thiouridine(34) synthase MnmA [bacterium 210820-DFI.6.37]